MNHASMVQCDEIHDFLNACYAWGLSPSIWIPYENFVEFAVAVRDCRFQLEIIEDDYKFYAYKGKNFYDASVINEFNGEITRENFYTFLRQEANA